MLPAWFCTCKHDCRPISAEKQKPARDAAAVAVPGCGNEVLLWRCFFRLQAGSNKDPPQLLLLLPGMR